MRSSSSSDSGGPSARPGRGLGWVVSQFALMAAILASVLLPAGWPAGAQHVLAGVGGALFIAGGAFAVWASRTLGRALTPFPKPNRVGLVTKGPFAVVRHPVYLGGIVLFVGYSLYAGIPALALTFSLAALWAAKARAEEQLLVAAYDDYPAYRLRVRWRLIPLVY